MDIRTGSYRIKKGFFGREILQEQVYPMIFSGVYPDYPPYPIWKDSCENVADYKELITQSAGLK